MIELEASDFDTHEYLKSVRELKNEDYMQCFEMYEKKYNINGFQSSKKNKKKTVSKEDWQL